MFEPPDQEKKSSGTGCIADLVAAYGPTRPAGDGKTSFAIPMKSSWLSMATWNLRLAVRSTIQSLARNCLFRRVPCTLYAISDARRPTGCTDIGDEGISLNHLEARVAFCVRLEAFAPGIRHFSPKPSFVNPVQIAADFATLQ